MCSTGLLAAQGALYLTCYSSPWVCLQLEDDDLFVMATLEEPKEAAGAGWTNAEALVGLQAPANALTGLADNMNFDAALQG